MSTKEDSQSVRVAPREKKLRGLYIHAHPSLARTGSSGNVTLDSLSIS